MLSAPQPHPAHLAALSRATLHHLQPCRDSDREKGSLCGINPWICPPAMAFLYFSSQYCCFIHGMAPQVFIQCHLPTWGQMEPSKPQACGSSRAQLWLPSISPWHLWKLSWKTIRSCCPWHLAGLWVVAASLKPQHTLQALTPRHPPQTLQQVPPHKCHSLEPLTLHVSPGMVALAAEEPVPTGVGNWGHAEPMSQTPAGKG